MSCWRRTPPATNRLADFWTHYGADVVTGIDEPRSGRRRRQRKPQERVWFDRTAPSVVLTDRRPRLVGFARVSTDEQTARLQLDALRAASCTVIHGLGVECVSSSVRAEQADEEEQEEQRDRERPDDDCAA